jgi:hypothetical protein
MKWFNGLERYERIARAYATLQRGRPDISANTSSVIQRRDAVKAVKDIITPTAGDRGYPLIIGECGTGKTSLLWLAVNEIEESREGKSSGIVYAIIPREDGKPLELSQVIGEALGLSSVQCN